VINASPQVAHTPRALSPTGKLRRRCVSTLESADKSAQAPILLTLSPFITAIVFSRHRSFPAGSYVNPKAAVTVHRRRNACAGSLAMAFLP
jgi:hypothetical protein